ncbi:GFA family protein [Roseovarius pacificus]|uniref:GFA family protein n=1 Tax=Roseovarius pacificus TaxID=337701 RepID=UPI00296A694C|nr:GFA family protein [Roseovarius pacificus]MDW3118737.1 GFA family protein [Roseovarius pacificus]
MTRTGSCLCGAVRFEIATPPETVGACHCTMCRKWSGGIFLGLEVGADAVTFSGAEEPKTYASSDWAERGFCATCGSSLFYRITAPGPHQGHYAFGLGTLDDADGIALTSEIFIDEKPDGYSFAGDTTKMTGAEVFALYAPSE